MTFNDGELVLRRNGDGEYGNVPARCHACGRYCDGCSFSKVYELPQVPPADDPDAARGILNGLLWSLLAWAMLLGFAALIYFNVHA